MIVFESADMDSAVEGVVDAIWFNQGQVPEECLSTVVVDIISYSNGLLLSQVCSAGSKLLVQETIFDKFIGKLKERMQHLRVGLAARQSRRHGSFG